MQRKRAEKVLASLAFAGFGLALALQLTGCGVAIPGRQNPLRSLVIAAANPTVAVGKSENFTATGTYEDGSHQDITEAVTWATAQPSVAAISATGVITGKGIGTTSVTATSGQVQGSYSFKVTPAVVVSIAVKPTNPTLTLGSTQQLTAVGTFSDKSSRDVTGSAVWSGSAAAIAAISPSGQVTAKARGMAVVTASEGPVSGSTSLTITPAGLTAIAVTAATTSIPLGNSTQLKATGSYTDGSSQDLTASVTWSAPGTVLSISASGMVAGHAVGTATVSAASGNVQGSLVMTVVPAALISIAISAPGPAVPLGTKQQLTATGTYSDSTTKDVTNVASWNSSAPGIAAIDSPGNITAKAKGSSVIRATVGSVSGSISLTITGPALTSLAVTSATSSVPLGNSTQMKATGSYSDGSTQDLTATVTWSASPTDAVAVSNSGLATARAIGTATVSAVSGSVQGSCTVTITQPVLASIAITPASPAIPVGEKQQLTATGTYSDGSTKDLTSSALWSSSAASVATINISGELRAKKIGTVTVTATSDAISGTDSISVIPPVLTGLDVTAAYPIVARGKPNQMTATGRYSDGTQQDLTNSVSWSASPAGIVTILNSGMAVTSGVGRVVVHAASGSVKGSDTFTVSAADLVSISVTPAGLSVPIGFTRQLTATGLYSDGTRQDVTSSASWASSAPGVILLRGAGEVTAKTLGSANITATSGGMSATSVVTASAAQALTSISVTPANSQVAMGRSPMLHANGTYADGSTADVTSTVTWTTADPTVAIVNTSGHIRPFQLGSTSFSASIGSLTTSGTVTVLPQVEINYYNNAHVPGAPTTTVRIGNPGQTNGTLCAMIYVFDATQELNECCGCPITADGIRNIDVNNDLTNNPLTGVKPKVGVIRIIPADSASNPTCNPASITPAGSLTAWGAHAQSTEPGVYAVTETEFNIDPLGISESSTLQGSCGYLQKLGSGRGICKCGFGD